MRRSERPKNSWERWRARASPFTLGDFDFRDKKLLYRTSLWLHAHGFSANRITLTGGLLLVPWIVMFDLFQLRYVWLQVFFILLIGATDFLDGSVARNNDAVTVIGTLGDYFRDLGLTIQMCRVSLAFGMDWYLPVTIIVFEIVFLCVKLLAWIWYAGRLLAPWKLFEGFALDNFQSSFEEDRFHFGLVCFGFPFYIVGAAYQNDFFYYAGLILIWLSFGFGLAVLRKEFKWIPKE